LIEHFNLQLDWLSQYHLIFGIKFKIVDSGTD